MKEQLLHCRKSCEMTNEFTHIERAKRKRKVIRTINPYVLKGYYGIHRYVGLRKPVKKRRYLW
jgi:hypothetical protein